MGRALRDEQGRIVALSGTLQDLSEREDARMRLEALADNLPSGAIYRLEGGLTQLRLSYIRDRKSTRLNSSHLVISYAVFCLKKKTTAVKRSSLSVIRYHQ